MVRNETMKFLCDEMLRGLGRWLRAAGYDTVIAVDGAADRDLLRQAAAEERIVVSRDRKLLEHRAASGRVVLLSAEGLDDCARELSASLHLDWSYRPFSRCLVCNSPLVAATVFDRAALSPAMVGVTEPLQRCPRCDKIYWNGGHVQRMRTRLGRYAAFGATPADGVTGKKAAKPVVGSKLAGRRRNRPPPSAS
jgi:uncharacterized protein with PIN domain